MVFSLISVSTAAVSYHRVSLDFVQQPKMFGHNARTPRYSRILFGPSASVHLRRTATLTRFCLFWFQIWSNTLNETQNECVTRTLLCIVNLYVLWCGLMTAKRLFILFYNKLMCGNFPFFQNLISFWVLFVFSTDLPPSPVPSPHANSEHRHDTPVNLSFTLLYFIFLFRDYNKMSRINIFYCR